MADNSRPSLQTLHNDMKGRGGGREGGNGGGDRGREGRREDGERKGERKGGRREGGKEGGTEGERERGREGGRSQHKYYLCSLSPFLSSIRIYLAQQPVVVLREPHEPPYESSELPAEAVSPVGDW